MENTIYKYSCLGYTPKILQVFNTIRWHVFWQCMYILTQGYLVNGLINIVLVSLERRFGLSSSRSALLVSAHDFGAVAFIVLVGYYGERFHKPRFMASGIFIMVIGSLLFALPHFISGKYEYTIADTGYSNHSENICSRGNNTIDGKCDIRRISHDFFYGIMILGSLLLGIGHVPVFVLGLGYIDENSKTRDSAFLMGFTFCAGAFGGAIGYVVGGQTLQLFVDIDTVSMDSVRLSPVDPQWVGAWWLGILIASGIFLIVAFPIFGYPKHLPGYENLQKQRSSEVYKGQDKGDENTHGVSPSACSGVQRHAKNLGRNPTFWLVITCGTLEVFIITGLSTFGAKICQQYFGINLTEAGYLMGLISVPGSGGGVLFGGYILKRLNLKIRGIIRMNIMCLIACILMGPVFLAYCPGRDKAGVTLPYTNSSDFNLKSQCNNDCGCTTAGYEPLCDSNGVEFFSPCYAGCSDVQSNGTGTKVYSNCTCTSTASVPGGTCGVDKCVWYYVFCVLLFFMMFLTFTTMSPSIQAMLRSIPQEERSLALGLQLLLGKLLGTTPGPLCVGAILDLECLVWQTSCGDSGSCWIYNTQGLSVKIMAWWVASKFLGTVLLLIADRTYKPPPEEDTEQTVHNVTYSTTTYL